MITEDGISRLATLIASSIDSYEPLRTPATPPFALRRMPCFSVVYAPYFCFFWLLLAGISLRQHHT